MGKETLRQGVFFPGHQHPYFRGSRIKAEQIEREHRRRSQNRSWKRD
jgi:hypothetical protein